jgi:hypothetical protein
VSGRLRWDVKDDGGRSRVQESLDKLRERVRILKARARVEARGAKEFSVALHAPIYPPRPDVLTLSPASDLDSRHAHAFFLLGLPRASRSADELSSRFRARASSRAEVRFRLAP